MTRGSIGAIGLGVLASTALLVGQSSAPAARDGEWRAYAADKMASRYSPLAQIDTLW